MSVVTSENIDSCYTFNDMGNKPSQTVESFNPDLTSVLRELEEGHYLFIVADQKKASLFLFKQGKLEAYREVMNPGVREKTKSDSGEVYGRNTKLTNRRENQIHDHLQLIMQEAVAVINGKHLNGVFIGGHKQFFNNIENALPKKLQQILRGTFVTELNIPREELIQHCITALERYIR